MKYIWDLILWLFYPSRRKADVPESVKITIKANN